jgi:hypothetical protein
MKNQSKGTHHFLILIRNHRFLTLVRKHRFLTLVFFISLWAYPFRRSNNLTINNEAYAIFESPVDSPAPGQLVVSGPGVDLQRKPLRNNVRSDNAAVLREKMSEYYMAKKNGTAGTRHMEARTMLKVLRDQGIVPILSPVPETASISNVNSSFFKSQEGEDKMIYQHLFNEKTRSCHKFGEKLFESGAYQGVKLSNTYMFEKHFNISTVLVEASDENWAMLVPAVAEHRPLSETHKAALCPVGVKSICMKSSRFSPEHKVDKKRDDCPGAIPCFDFDESVRYAILSLDIEGLELEFIKFRKPNADIIIVEVIQWARQINLLSTALDFVAYLADSGYYLYGETFGFRNFVFVSQALAENCFAPHIIKTPQ